jgi:predicted RNA-binding Zn-ribbon protein involved in translation (DUF1610 family)
VPNIFGAASRAAVVKLTCPKCGEVQARALGAEDEAYACRNCGKVFTRSEGERRDEDEPAKR